jgi:hypothetical protein
MEKHFFTLIITLLFSVWGYSQTIPIDYHNLNIRKAQKTKTDSFIAFLEHKDINNAIKLIDTSFLKTKSNYRDSLTAYAKELSKHLKTTELSVVIVYPDDRYNTYRCRYYNQKGDFFYIDLYYNVGQPNSQIAQIYKKTEKELAKTRRKSTKRAKRKEEMEIPPPPPPTQDKRI